MRLCAFYNQQLSDWGTITFKLHVIYSYIGTIILYNKLFYNVADHYYLSGMLSTEARIGAAKGSWYGIVSTAFLVNEIWVTRGDATAYMYNVQVNAHYNHRKNKIYKCVSHHRNEVHAFIRKCYNLYSPCAFYAMLCLDRDFFHVELKLFIIREEIIIRYKTSSDYPLR